MNRIVIALGALVVALLVLSSTVFVVDQRKVAVVYTFGEIKSVVSDPGLHWQLPPPMQNVVFLDKRIQTLDNPDPRPIFTAEKKSLVIDWLVKWRIKDPRQFIRNNGVDEQHLVDRLSPVIQAAFNDEVTKHTVRGVLADDRDKVMQNVRTRLTAEAPSFGIEIVDVRIKRVDFVADITDAVYNRMKSERKQVANQLRAEGSAAGEKIRAEADKQRTVILANAYRDAQQIMGAGDAKASQIYADAFGKDPKFAAFYRSLSAYRASFANKSDVMVIDGSGEFFKDMQGPGTGGAAGTPSRARRP